MIVLSVCIPTRNRHELLMRAIRSVLPLPSAVELVISDNQSVDATQNLASTDPGMLVLRQSASLGMAENWNACLKAASGEWILVLSDDDYLEQGFIPSVLARLVELPESCSLLITDHRQEYSGPTTKVPIRTDVQSSFRGERMIPSREFARACLEGFHPQLCSVVFRRSSLARGFDQSMNYAIDVDAWLHSLGRDSQVAIHGGACAVYTLSQVNASWGIGLKVKLREEVQITEMMRRLACGERLPDGNWPCALRRLLRQSRYLSSGRLSGLIYCFLVMACLVLRSKARTE